METINVYVEDSCVYNLENMVLLDQFPNQHQETLYQHLGVMRQTYDIQLAVISFNQPLQEILYHLFPQIVIIINPQSVVEMIHTYLGYSLANSYDVAQAEVAATVTGDVSLQDQIIPISCQDIYGYETKEQAISHYKTWQSYVPLGIKSFHHVIRIVDYYYEEVFNYFEFKSIIDQFSIKI